MLIFLITYKFCLNYINFGNDNNLYLIIHTYSINTNMNEPTNKFHKQNILDKIYNLTQMSSTFNSLKNTYSL